MKVSTVIATIADSPKLNRAIEYSTIPSEAETSTMQMAMNIVEMRIIERGFSPGRKPAGERQPTSLSPSDQSDAVRPQGRFPPYGIRPPGKR
ncbi:hypothetical protein [Rhodopseudomonas faecalis]|uniref:hypothetical protein n=1 Tax=Rhodopseudomonas faecalis TaxID=99655 RepID=UPI001FE0A99B|nr:hypothetical protein [Rhodopseudomonas faecalis]